MVTNTATDAWVVLANFHQARLMRCSRTPAGRCHVTEVDTTESPVPAHMPRQHVGLESRAIYNYDANLHRLEEERRRFAKQLARWIDERLNEFEMKRLTVFAPARSTQHLRKHIRHAHQACIELRTENLMHLPDDALKRHETVLGLLPRRAAPSEAIRDQAYA